MRVTIAGLICLAAGTALAQTNIPTQNPPASNPPSTTVPAAPRDTMGQAAPAPSSSVPKIDEDFVKKATQASLSQIRLGQLALKNGSTAQVRKLGQVMIDDHQKATDRLRSIATREGLTLPMDVTAEQQATIDRLTALSGSQFDSAYMDQVKSDHEAQIALFQDEAKNGSDAQLKHFAQSTVPSLRRHQQMASRPGSKM
jgi:putative membrane protein